MDGRRVKWQWEHRRIGKAATVTTASRGATQATIHEGTRLNHRAEHDAEMWSKARKGQARRQSHETPTPSGGHMQRQKRTKMATE